MRTKPKASSLVEMLAVMSVIMILLGAYATSTVRSKSMSEASTVSVHAAALEAAMAKYAAKGLTAQNNWSTATTLQEHYNSQLQPLMGKQIPYSELAKVFVGYTVTMPVSVFGQIIVTGPDGVQVYPRITP